MGGNGYRNNQRSGCWHYHVQVELFAHRLSRPTLSNSWFPAPWAPRGLEASTGGPIDQQGQRRRTSTPATLLVLGLLRRDDGWPTSQPTLVKVTTLLARSLRSDDWLASSGPTEFVIVMTGPTTGAHAAAERLVAAVEGLGIPGLAAGAGIAPLTADLTAGEALRRATLSLTAARRVGAGTVIRYRAP
jgi:GGDEF domain-containing protein